MRDSELFTHAHDTTPLLFLVTSVNSWMDGLVPLWSNQLLMLFLGLAAAAKKGVRELRQTLTLMAPQGELHNPPQISLQLWLGYRELRSSLL